MVRLTKQTRDDYIRTVVDVITSKKIERFRELFLDLHPTDQADLYLLLDAEDRQFVYAALTPEEMAEVFKQLDVSEQKELILELDREYSTAMLNDMYADDAANFLAEIDQVKAQEILVAMNKKEASEIKELMSYPPETAGAIMTKEFIVLRSTDTAADVIDHLRKEGPDAETIYYLYVVDEQKKLVGVVSLRDLITAPSDQTIETIMSTRVVSVLVGEDQEDVAKLIKKYDFLAAPVVTEQGTLVGIVTVDDIIDVLEEETEEDFGEMAAARGSMDTNISAFTAARKRAPWIIMLMFLGLITAEVIGQFEETLEAVILLSVFIPLIMDSAGNTGTQALAVVVRGLAVGTVDRSTVGKMLKREFGTGIMLGIMCAVTLLIVIPFLYGSFVLAGIVGVSLLLTLSVATMVGATIPLIINKLKIDPAVASGPFITTLNDILGLFIYFSIATALLQYLPQ
ncbi:magnesium transporter [Halalkalibacterium halodurans]|jgi:magnesium transporter|nr:magnesium transporter [Halalkalibacterium halodurans]MDY7222508.1 magnesium transporter [Halalkalibacterium halodurans]MDY7241729.1 magnesium transporter [Halalkalibacterium halodurans]MED3648287.1 magnesium transporter [Halalkalibacterium halodurans]MED4163378.1 magnesium transporter [Halalkalibacterium halodurans]TES53894.1 magnesium transporter [Halalkalibacterium halodurans]